MKYKYQLFDVGGVKEDKVKELILKSRLLMTAIDVMKSAIKGIESVEFKELINELVEVVKEYKDSRDEIVSFIKLSLIYSTSR